jgi:hypothetical protein
MSETKSYSELRTKNSTDFFVRLYSLKLLRVLLLPLGLLLFLSNCHPKNPYEKEILLLDSIKIVLQVKLNEVKKAEVNVNSISFSKYETYSRFLTSNLKDTIGKSEASALSNFIIAGRNISNFMAAKPALIKETEITISQIQKLSADLKENNVAPNSVQSFFNSEKIHAEQLINTIEQHMRTLNISLINFRNALPRTENLIRDINNGQLPSVVANNVSD